MMVRLFFVVLFLAGCTKVELDPATLNDNPFDSQYTGGSVFSITGHQFYTTMVGAESVQRLRVFFSLDRTRFNSDGPFRVRVRSVSSGGLSYLQHTEMPDGTFHLVVFSPVQGETRCWELALGNGDEFPNDFEHCFTIP